MNSGCKRSGEMFLPHGRVYIWAFEGGTWAKNTELTPEKRDDLTGAVLYNGDQLKQTIQEVIHGYYSTTGTF
jgi:3-methyladenine DNA glycosylase Mpg